MDLVSFDTDHVIKLVKRFFPVKGQVSWASIDGYTSKNARLTWIEGNKFHTARLPKEVIHG